MAAESLNRLEHDRVALVRYFEERRAQLEEEIGALTDQLDALRRRIEAAQARAEEAEREIVVARQAARRDVSAIIASAERQAEEMLATAQHRSAELERASSQSRSALLAEAQAHERQVREVEERLTRLLRPAPPADTQTRGVDEEPGPSPAAETPAPSPADVSGPAEAAGDPSVAAGPPPAETEVAANPPTTTLVFDGVSGFQAARSVELAIRALPGIRTVTTDTFEDDRLTMHVTHEMGEELPRAILALETVPLELRRAEPERVEFRLRSS